MSTKTWEVYSYIPTRLQDGKIGKAPIFLHDFKDKGSALRMASELRRRKGAIVSVNRAVRRVGYKKGWVRQESQLLRDMRAHRQWLYEDRHGNMIPFPKAKRPSRRVRKLTKTRRRR